MRTKTLLLTAAFTAAGIATSMAQAVYSVNMVGYINKTLLPGLQMVANQLNASPNNQVQNVFGTPDVDGTGILTVDKFNPGTGGYDQAIYDDLDKAWVQNGNMTLNPGEGAFVTLNANTPVEVTFVGEVQLSSSISIINGLKIYSSVLPQSGPLDAMEFPDPGLNATLTVNTFNRDTGGYDLFFIDDLDLTWNPSVPVLDIAESFFLSNDGPAVNWARTFAVGP